MYKPLILPIYFNVIIFYSYLTHHGSFIRTEYNNLKYIYIKFAE